MSDLEMDWYDVGVQGPGGLSAYALAVKNGFEGTESEWLATLVGPSGQDGADGADAEVTPASVQAAIESEPAAARVSVEVDALRDLRGGASGAIRAAIRAGRSLGVVIVGDSTGNETNEWAYRFAEHLADLAPGHRVIHDLWSGSAWTRTTLQDPGGGDRYWLRGSNGYEMAAGDAVHAGGPELVIEAELQLPDWSNGTTRRIIEQWGLVGNRSYQFLLGPTGLLGFAYYESDGTTYRPWPNSSVAVPFADGARGWVRVHINTNYGGGNGAINYATSTDGVTWTALGTANQTVGVTPGIHVSDFSISVMGIASSGDRLYNLRIRNSLTGPTINNVAVDNYSPGSSANTSILAGDPVLLVSNMSVAGWSSASATAAQLDNLPNHGAALAMHSLGLNNYYSLGPVGAGWLAELDRISGLLAGRCPAAAQVYLTQNPTNYASGHANARHRLAMSQMEAWARREGHQCIDTMRAFDDDPRGLAVLIAGDGLHPTTDGRALQAQAVIAAFDQGGF